MGVAVLIADVVVVVVCTVVVVGIGLVVLEVALGAANLASKRVSIFFLSVMAIYILDVVLARSLVILQRTFNAHHCVSL